MAVVHSFVLLLAVSGAFALTCYKCDSSESSLCNYGITSFTYNTVDCNNEVGGGLINWLPKQCVKIVAKSKNGDEYVARGCMPQVGSVCSAVAKTLGFFGSIESDVSDINCYPCDGDKCNSATKYTAYSFLGVLLAVLAFLF